MMNGRRAVLTVVVATVLLCSAIPATRTAALQAVGSALVVEDPMAPADVIVLTTDGDGPAVLEAVDLVHQGFSKTVAVFADPPDAVDLEFIRRGLPYEDLAARSMRSLNALGVSHVIKIGRAVGGTEDEGQVLPQWCDENHFGSIIIVSTPDHSRRLRRVLHRAMRGHPTRVAVRFARFSTFQPDRWWQTRGGLRTGIIELEKLMLDLVRHPLSG